MIARVSLEIALRKEFDYAIPPELAARIADAEPKLILCASCGLEPGRTVAYKPLLDEAIKLAAHKPAKVLLIDRGLSPMERVAGACGAVSVMHRA